VDGGRLAARGAVVFVNTPAPVEMQDAQFASRVIENILKYDIRYTYVFQESTNFATMGAGINSLVRALKGHKEPFEANLAKVRRLLNIYFAPVYGGLEFCIHDAESPDRAQCYMRCRPPGADPKEVYWIEWVERHQAAEFVKLITSISDPRETQDRRIFHNSREVRILSDKGRAFTYRGQDLKDEINKAIGLELSAEEKKEVIEACFGIDDEARVR
jgi:hypothetical protein